MFVLNVISSLISGCQHWTRHHLHGRPTDLPESKCRRVLPASAVDLCYRALDYRHVCTVANGPSRLCSPLLFAWISTFPLFVSVRTPRLIFYRNRTESDLRLRFSVLFGHTLRTTQTTSSTATTTTSVHISHTSAADH